MMKRDKTLEAILVIVTGFVLLYFIYQSKVLLYIAFGAGVTGIFVHPLASLLAKGWYRLGEILGFLVSKIILFVLFYLFLVPIALLYRRFHKDTLQLKRSTQSNWIDRNHLYISNDLRNIW